MRFRALATDYDGTLAHDGIVDEPTLAAVDRLRASGRLAIMVTGRELKDLLLTFPHIDRFDRVVAENGAMVYNPAGNEIRMLTEPPSEAFLAALVARRVPLSVGHSIVATIEPYEKDVLDVIRDLGLEWHVIFNKGSVMALPSGITKATGFAAALKELDLNASEVVGIGDAENDHAFLAACGLAVAVSNALPSIKERAHWVTQQPRGAGVMELIDRLIADDLADFPAAPRGNTDA